ncbi:hypothetical protein [Desulfosarcina cetonica]|uniref:hypothetical protein n=1 Tax=Desulfosarcina cetonica TaxID=90730 RepID=UPI001FF004FD|nr:hypothetical protein [Desulfosarcina cetonica]
MAVVFLVATVFFTGLYGNYLAHPTLFLVPALAVVGLVGIRFFLVQQAAFKAGAHRPSPSWPVPFSA